MTKRLNQDLVAGALVILAAGVLFANTSSIPKGGALWPRLVLGLLMSLATLVAVRGLRKAGSDGQTQEGEGARLTARLVASPLLVVALTTTYLVLVTLAGFFPATIAFLAAYLWYAQVRNWIIYVTVLGGVSSFIYLLFVLQLNVQLPTGLVFS